MAYKQGRSEANSPTYKQGIEDAEQDAILVASCPPNASMGMQQPGAMYRRGYESVPQVPHVPCKNCRREAS